MDLIPIRKTKSIKAGQEIEVYIIPAMSMQKKDGSIKKIPHPLGQDNIVFKNLENAIEAINLAGFGYTLGDKQVPPSEIPSGYASELNNAIEPLLNLLKNDNPGAVASAAYALGELRSHEAIKPLLQVLGVDDIIIRKNATEALAKIGDNSIRGLIEALDDKNWVVRNSAAIALGEITNYSSSKILVALKPLVKTLDDSNWIVKSSAATAIGKISAYIREQYQQ